MVGTLAGLLGRIGRSAAAEGPVRVPPVVVARPPSTLPLPREVSARVGSPVSLEAGASWGAGAIWRLQGDLPDGLSFDAATGAIKGTPLRPGTAEGLVLRSYGPAGRMGCAPFRIAVAA